MLTPHDKPPIPSVDSAIQPLALLSHVEVLVSDRVKEALDKHELANANTLKNVEERLKKLESGFPNEDPPSHRRVHEKYIEEAQEREQMVRGAKHKVFEASVWGALLLLASALWDYLRTHLK